MKYVKLFIAITLVTAIGISAAIWKGPDSFVFAWILNFILMTAVLFYTQTFKPALTSGYYKAKPWERQGAVYKWFGVNLFRKMLVWVGWEKLNKAANPVQKKTDALRHLEYSTRQSEFGHVIIFLIVLPINIFVAIYYGISKSFWLLALNIVLNVYPILVQRYNRPRLLKILNRQ